MGAQPPQGPWSPPQASAPAGAAPRPPSGRGPIGAVAALAVLAVVAALILAIVLAVRDDNEQAVVRVPIPSDASAGRPAALPTTTAPPTTAPPTTEPPTAAATTVERTVPSTAAPSRPTSVSTSAATTPAITTPATTTPATTTPATTPATTVPVTVTTGAPAASADAVLPPAPSAAVVNAAEESPETVAALDNAKVLAAALVDGDWALARQLGPTDRRRTDAQLEAGYGPATDITLMPARVVRSGQWIDLRLGLVAHEEHDTGPATAVMCVHWRVNESTRSVERISSVRLRLEQGLLDPSLLVDELTSTCATYPLR